ncbi:C39 family peptidase [Chengkuizengella axinellae]|uniref:C39 family peptidase n=1 Tax=Chengkuizengella axinellae TaxID=3064388 RepID=A0ABT9J1R2_9BACL|nr:C39 family peptidase [Chengkuizengella sp. 2205SS18-9]MDP5275428.1 C39 family peptidase [Chengkuizengella sp. 2205SS18-9]
MISEMNIERTVNSDFGMNYCFYVPRYPQHFAAEDWPNDVSCEGEGPDYWGRRCCGLASLRMIIGHFNKNVPMQYELLKNGLNQNAYCTKGWIHKGLAELGSDYGLKGTPIAIKDGAHLQKILVTNGPVIVSITESFPEDGRKGGHLIVVCGRHQHDQETTITFRDPSKWGENHSHVSEKRFLKSFSGRGIYFSEKL